MALTSWGYCAFSQKFWKIDADQGQKPLRYNHLYMAAPALASLCALAGMVAQEPPISTVDPILGGFESGLHDRGT
jgi:hypothetical protein